MAASLLHGPAALDSDASLETVVVTGMLVHLALSAIFGLGFAVLIGARRVLRGSGLLLVGIGMLYGACLWLANYYDVALTYAWEWIVNLGDPLVWAVTHAFGYGAALALYLHRAVIPRRRVGLD